MEVKKSPEADLERHRATRLMIGFMVALSIVFIALEWTSPVKEADMDWELPDLVFEEELDIPTLSSRKSWTFPLRSLLSRLLPRPLHWLLRPSPSS